MISWFTRDALPLRMHTNVVDFRVMRRLCRREWNWQSVNQHSWDPRQRTTWSRRVTSDFNSLQRLQNRYARLVLNADFFTPHTSLLRQLNWQSVLQRVDYQFCLFMFKVINGLVPEYLKDLIIFRTPQIPTRYALNSPLYIPKPKNWIHEKVFSIPWLLLMEQTSTFC